jgi:hypothetical protein
MKLFTASVFFLFVAVCVAQVMFQKTYGGTGQEEAFSIDKTNDGGYIIVGYTKSNTFGGSDVNLLRVNQAGEIIWTKTFGTYGDDSGLSVHQTSDGGFIIAGYANYHGVFDYGDVYIIKTDSSGNAAWIKNMGAINSDDSDFGTDVKQTGDGGYIITGWTRSFGPTGTDVYLIKTNNFGDTLWTKRYGGNSDERSYSVLQTSDGGYLIAGGSGSYNLINYDVYLIKTDSSGNMIWSKVLVSLNNEYCNAIQQTNDGGYIIIGNTSSSGAGGSDIFLIKIDTSANIAWSKTYGGVNDDYGSSVQQTNDGGYIMTGSTTSYGAGYFDVYLIKTDNTGDTLWTKTMGGVSYDRGWCVQLTSDNGFIIAGGTGNFGSGIMDVYIIKTDSIGNTGCNESTTNTIVTNQTNSFLNATTLVSSGLEIISWPPLSSSGNISTTICYVGINETSSAISLFPNPAATEIRIKSQESGIKSVEIYDVLGEKIFSTDVTAGKTDELTINATTFTAGIYFVSIKTTEGVVMKKVVVQR